VDVDDDYANDIIYKNADTTWQSELYIRGLFI
jgi:hypothetical protein